MSSLAYNWPLKNQTFGRFATVHGVFDNEEIRKIIELGESQISHQAKIRDKSESVLNPDYRSTSVSWIPSTPTENQWLFQKLTDCIEQVNERFFQFELKYIENLQYSTYQVGDFYKEHDDMIDGTVDSRKLSFSLQLTNPEDYEGGELILNIGLSENGNLTKADKQKGSITFFPSYTMHEVSKVVSGTRKALVGWVNGPRFR